VEDPRSLLEPLADRHGLSEARQDEREQMELRLFQLDDLLVVARKEKARPHLGEDFATSCGHQSRINPCVST
jgi:hypothetical protein